MIKFWIILFLLLAIFTFIIGKVSLKHYKKENSEKMWRQQGMRTRYWQGVILVSFGLTSLTVFILKWTHVITF